MTEKNEIEIDISLIIPVFNGAKWVEKCFTPILKQTFSGKLEIVVWDDHSTDGSESLIENFREEIEARNWLLVIGKDKSCQKPEGCGVAKNKACKVARGKYFAFQDIDDEMMPERLQAQFEAAEELGENYIIGTKLKEGK